MDSSWQGLFGIDLRVISLGIIKNIAKLPKFLHSSGASDFMQGFILARWRHLDHQSSASKLKAWCGDSRALLLHSHKACVLRENCQHVLKETYQLGTWFLAKACAVPSQDSVGCKCKVLALSKDHVPSRPLALRAEICWAGTYERSVARYAGSRVHGFAGSRFHEFAGSRVQGFAGSRVHGFAGSRVHGFAGSRVHGFAGLRVHGFAGSQVRGFAGSRVHGFAGSRVRGFAGLRDRGFAGSRRSRVHGLLCAATKHGHVSCVYRG